MNMSTVFNFQCNFHMFWTGVGGVEVWPGLLKQKVAGSNPVATIPERGALRSQLSWVYAISSGRLSRMIGKPWLRVKWGGSLPKDLESCKGILQLSCKTLVKYQNTFILFICIVIGLPVRLYIVNSSLLYIWKNNVSISELYPRLCQRHSTHMA